MRERVLVREIITLTSLDGAARSACTDALVGRGLLPTLASAELWEAVEPPGPVAGARGSDCFSAGFRVVLISGTPAGGGTFDWTGSQRRSSKRLLEAGLVLGVPVAVA